MERKATAPIWGTGGPEFKSRRSDQHLAQIDSLQKKPLGPLCVHQRRNEMKSGACRRAVLKFAVTRRCRWIHIGYQSAYG